MYKPNFFSHPIHYYLCSSSSAQFIILIKKIIEERKREAAIAPTAVADIASGEDELGIRKDAEALAQILALKDLTPPFVLGLLGGENYNPLIGHFFKIYNFS